MLRRPLGLLLLAVVAGSSVAHAKRCPNIMFVVDKSGSMVEDPLKMGKKPSKWDLLVSAITLAVNRHGERIPFGLVTFSSANGGGAMSCYQETVLEAPCRIGNGPSISARLQNIIPYGNTNTSEGMRRALNDGSLNDLLRGNYIVLITDGDPNCSNGEPVSTFKAISDAAAANPTIHTLVVGFDGSGGVNPANLNQMAINGKEPIAGCQMNKTPCYYSASSAQKFLMALDAIVGGLAQGCDESCFSNDCPVGQICTIASTCAAPSCQPDPCLGAACGPGTYCNKDGHCSHPCPHCNADEVCLSEICKPAPACNCPPPSVCDPRTGLCAPDRCAGPGAMSCPAPSSCDPVSGCCADDPCRLVNCPPHATCFGGYCMTDPPAAAPDLALPQDLTVAPAVDLSQSIPGLHEDGCGCVVGGRGPRPGAGGLLLVVLGLVALRRCARTVMNEPSDRAIMPSAPPA